MRSNYKAAMIFFVIIACGVASYFTYDYWENRVPKLESFDGIRLGMSEVDITVLYGRRPDCPNEEGTTFSVLNYLGTPDDSAPAKGLMEMMKWPCRLHIVLEKTDEGNTNVYRICSGVSPSELGSMFGKRDIIERLGTPSYRSINQTGTLVYSSYPSHNLALMTEGRFIRRWCVTNDFPVKFEKEYQS